MALTLNGKDDRLCRADFRALASTAGVKAADADAAIDEMIQRMKQAAEGIALPGRPDHGPEAAAMAAKMIEIVQTRIGSFE